ncbi:cold-shock protein [Anaplasma phagocytophilum]|uniref:Cold shock-like protein CspA n=9 Tax=Anaplasma phagocytophilum TaxID=948 RepID=A0A098EDV7_ANAPH|nr:cold shock domain-containing protein [Anaplasma phagocytophilum]KJV64948.1 'Cold-shock' DNA-binding domain protein [Anaplasma phagocytophilum str. ApMUC09]KJV67858.1 'Cold-shock' DNA-binding domain protein [Anaplasma phagocytophilum str. ApNP]KJZ99090.1 'Cold-shock' DNA-binding domain protein [Anaplasma phagocytophilum str. CR1007]ABD43234.1 cold shock protein, CSD family [Anaplasma phagocytophilum str. HZ]AGR78618.1 cold-shock protein [Anaplasma phagocytophilum str. HZ2]
MSQLVDGKAFYTGHVKWFSVEKGYGFICKDSSEGSKGSAMGHGEKDVFVHITSLQRSRIDNLREGQKVRYQLDENNGKVSAVNLEVLSE